MALDVRVHVNRVGEFQGESSQGEYYRLRNPEAVIYYEKYVVIQPGVLGPKNADDERTVEDNVFRKYDLLSE